MKVLGIETSCDETSAAIVDGDKNILSHIIRSQLKEHAAYRGVVPEIAARAHLDHIGSIIPKTMEQAGLNFSDLDAVAVTAGPGLIGGVMVGVMAAKSIALAHKLPLIAVNHLEGHALTPRLTHDVAFPYLLLLVSGGHTQILIVHDVGRYTRLGTTLDDAVGEAFDKSAKLMGLGYPGGPAVEQYALRAVNPSRFPLPRPLKGQDHCHFSLSGLKTALRRHVESLPAGDLAPEDVADCCAALQEAIGDVLVDRLQRAIALFKAQESPENPTLVVAGGVAANLFLRDRITDLTQAEKIDFIAPPVRLCSDNGAMIAWAGVERLKRGMVDTLDVKARPRWPLDPDAEGLLGQSDAKSGIKA